VPSVLTATSTAGASGVRLPQRPTAATAPPSVSVSAGQARHPLPPKPQFSTSINSAAVAPAGALPSTQSRGATTATMPTNPNVAVGGPDVGAMKRKREAIGGATSGSGSVASLVTAFDPKKRRTAPPE